MSTRTAIITLSRQQTQRQIIEMEMVCAIHNKNTLHDQASACYDIMLNHIEEIYQVMQEKYPEIG